MEAASNSGAAHTRHPPGMMLDIKDSSQRARQRSTASPGPYSPLSSAPTTPGLKTPLSRRTSQPATSPLLAASRTNPLQRASSSASMRSSPQLARKGSRQSLGGAAEEDRRPTPKRSISNLIAGLREAHSSMQLIEEPIPLTAPQIAMEHFTRELLGHAQPGVHADTMVILHDACYGHRYSRLKTTKSTLSMIVERPERIHASILGASTAYVRLGGHHSGASHAPHPDRTDLSRPPFTVRRSGRSLDVTSTFVTNVHGTDWMGELKRMCHATADKLAAGAKEVARAPMAGEPEKRSLHEGDLYLAPESLDAFQGALGGVADAVDAVFDDSTSTSRAFVAVRPPGHHCSADHPSGFCWLNNVHVGIEYAAQTHGLTHAAILDFDLHHGDGSQAIAWQRNSKNEQKRLMPKQFMKSKLGPDIGYYSLHDINSYPCEAGDDEKVQAASLCIENAHGQSIWNVHLQSWKTVAEFWKLYEDRYQILLEKARNFLRAHSERIRAEGRIRPKAAIFISAGFDASEWEGEGMQRHKVNVPTDFYARFTREVVELAQEADLGCTGRVISVLEGGYSDRALCSGVLSHLSGLCTGSVAPATNGVGSILGLSEHMNSLSINATGNGATGPYDSSWWSAANLTALEMKVNPPPPPPPGKKVRAGPQPTYATPTESFAYKVIDANKFARSVSGTMREAPVPTRPPTPPAPEVDWVVATQELSKLLIPMDRQTKSCTPEELGGVRTKKDRQSAGPILTTAEKTAPRQLRDRKVKDPIYAESLQSDDLETLRSVSRASRRETIAVLPSADDSAPSERRGSRRLSMGSTVSLAKTDMDIDTPPVPSLPSKPTSGPINGTGDARSVRPGSGGVDAKKARAPVKARKVSTSQLPTGIPSVATSRPAVPAPGSSNGAAPASATTNLDLDNLTSGMRKITLKVSTTKEEHDRKQKEKLDAERRARALKGAETRRLNAAAKKAAVKENSTPMLAAAKTGSSSAHRQTTGVVPSRQMPASGTADSAVVPLGEALPANGPMAVPESTGVNAATGQIAPANVSDVHPSTGSLTDTVVAPPQLHPTSSIPIEAIQLPAYDSMDISRPHPAQTGGAPETSQIPQLQPMLECRNSNIAATRGDAEKGMPPSSSIPVRQLSHGFQPMSPTRSGPAQSPHRSPGGKQLPTWSSTGPIPFSSNSNPASPVKSMRSPPRNLWKHQRPTTSDGGAGNGNGVGATMLKSELLNEAIEQEVWDVPETPQE